MKKSLTLALCCQEPFRLFFLFGLLCQFVGVSHWALYYWGWIANYSGYFHAFVQIQLYETAFVIGFLGMALPRFWEAPGAQVAEVFVGVALFFWQHWRHWPTLGPWLVEPTCSCCCSLPSS